MHNIITTITINDATTTEVVPFEFADQEEVLDFLDSYESMELSRLYDELRKHGDRTFAALKSHHRKAMTRMAEGTARTDGHEPVNGSIVITVERVA